MMNKIVEKLRVLEDMARQAELLEEPFVRSSLTRLSMFWDEVVAHQLHVYLLNQVDGSYFTDDVFELPSVQDDVEGELNLGEVLGREEITFRHGLKRTPMHILGGGTSGSGKTNMAKVLISEAVSGGLGPIKVSDPKSEYADVAVKHDDFHVLRWNEFRFNPLTPPPRVPENEWWQTIVNHMSYCFNFWEGAESLLLRLLWNLSGRKKKTTILDLKQAVENEKPRYKEKDFLVMGTVSSRLELILYTSEEVVMTEANMLEVLANRRYVVQTTGLMSEIESWFLEFLLIWEFMYRIWNPGQRDLALYVFDECQHRLFSKEKERNVKKISSAFISMLVDEARALNMALCSLSQEPSSLVNAVLNNSYLKMAFHLGSGQEVRVMKEAMGLTEDQAQVLHTMETGEVIVRMAGGYMEAFPAKIREFESPGEIDWVEFWKHQAEIKRQLYLEAGVSGKELGRVGGGEKDSGYGGDKGTKGSSSSERTETWDVLR